MHRMGSERTTWCASSLTEKCFSERKLLSRKDQEHKEIRHYFNKRSLAVYYFLF